MRAMHTRTEPGNAVDWRKQSPPSTTNTRTSKGGWSVSSSGASRLSLLVLCGARMQRQMLIRHGVWGACLSLSRVDGDGGTKPVAYQSPTAACLRLRLGPTVPSGGRTGLGPKRPSRGHLFRAASGGRQRPWEHRRPGASHCACRYSQRPRKTGATWPCCATLFVTSSSVDRCHPERRAGAEQ